MATTLMRLASNNAAGGAGGKRYRIERTLGEGTYGKVKLAYDNYTREKVAIKIIRKENVKTKKDMERVRREIDILSVLRHPHIIKVIDVVETRTNIIIVMEYAVNGELFDYINERRYLEEAEARKYFRQIVSAVDYCHKNLIVHRDLKLENLLLDKDMNIKIIDFGLSNQYDSMKLLNTFCGSPLYASPEMIQGREYRGPEVDCWSLGVVLYTLLCGTMPFDDSDMTQLVESITTATYPIPRGLTKLALDLLSRLLRANPKKRATIENIRVHPWTNDGYTKPPMQQPLSNINHTNRRRLSSKISCLSDTPIKGLTPSSRTKSDNRLSDSRGVIKQRTPASVNRPTPRSKTDSERSIPTPNVTNSNVKRKLIMEPASPQPTMKMVKEEPEPEAEVEQQERPKSATAMLKTPSKPPRPSRSKLDRAEILSSGIKSPETGSFHERSKSEATSPEVQTTPKKSSSYDEKSHPSPIHDAKFKLTPDRRTMSESTSLAKYTDYDSIGRTFKPPIIKDAGEITMIDSESHLFDGFGGSTKSIQHMTTDLENHINELNTILKEKETDEITQKSPDTITPVDSRQTPTPSNTTPRKKPLEQKSSLTKPAPQKSTARSKAAINKSGLVSKKPVADHRSSVTSTTSTASAQRAKSCVTRDRPSSVKTRSPGTAQANSVVNRRNRRNSDISGSLSNLSIKSNETDLSIKSEVISTRSRVSKPGDTAQKRNTRFNVKSKVDCHRDPPSKTKTPVRKTDSVDRTGTGTKSKDGVKSKISSMIRNKATANKREDSITPSTPITPRAKRTDRKKGEVTPGNRDSMLPRYRGTTTTTPSSTPHRSRSNTEPTQKLSADIKKIPFR